MRPVLMAMDAWKEATANVPVQSDTYPVEHPWPRLIPGRGEEDAEDDEGRL